MEEPDHTDTDVKTTVLTNIPIVTDEVFTTEHILPDELAVFSNSDGNLTINTVEQVVEVAVSGDAQEQQDAVEEELEEDAKTAVYITQIGEPAEEMMDGEYEEYELYPEEEEEEEDEDGDGQDEEDDSSMVDDPNFEVDERDTEEEEMEQFECAICKKNFKTPAVSTINALFYLYSTLQVANSWFK